MKCSIIFNIMLSKFVGDDGTEYIQTRFIKQPTGSRIDSKPARDETYASIDHTVRMVPH